MFEDDSDNDRKEAVAAFASARLRRTAMARAVGSILAAERRDQRERSGAAPPRWRARAARPSQARCLRRLLRWKAFSAQPMVEPSEPWADAAAGRRSQEQSRWSLRDLLSPKLKIGQV